MNLPLPHINISIFHLVYRVVLNTYVALTLKCTREEKQIGKLNESAIKETSFLTLTMYLMVPCTCELLASNLNTDVLSAPPYLIYTLLPNIGSRICTTSMLQKWNKTECN